MANPDCPYCKNYKMIFVVAFNTGKGGGDASLYQCAYCKRIEVKFDD